MNPNHRLITTMIALLSVCLGSSLSAYPLDGEEESGIRRLEGYRLKQEAPTGAKLRQGQLWNVADVKLSLLDYQGPDFDTLPQDPALNSALTGMLSKRDPSYSMVLVDFSDASNLRWAGLRPDLRQNPGSVGKLLCMTALFHALQEVFPNPADRARVLKTAEVKAGDWVINESHKVPKWNALLRQNISAVTTQNDIFRLSEWVDHAISASANGAGAVIWREAMLLRQFGKAYPIDEETRIAFFKTTPKAQLSKLARDVITEPLIAAGIDTNKLQQGSFFTSSGKRIVPGITSFGTTRELARLLFRMEQGKLVDAWSSLQMKKYMYLTKNRYRYSYAPELNDKAIFFKSGSLYSCRPIVEGETSRCGKYMGNKENLMNSVAVVEGPTAESPKYIATLMSNVMEVNSAWDHSRIGAATDAMIVTRKAQTLKETASEKEISDSGRSE